MSATASRRRLPDFDALQADALAELEQLREQRAHLALESLTNPKAAARLGKVEEDVREAERRIERIDLARSEAERQALEAEHAAEAQARADALQRARGLQAERQRLAGQVDEAAAAYAAALRAWDRVTTDQEASLRLAGWPGDTAAMARPRPWMIECGLAHALRTAGCPRGIIELGSVVGLPQQHIRQLAAADARPVEPSEDRA
jgi:hypothetical protein